VETKSPHLNAVCRCLPTTGATCVSAPSSALTWGSPRMALWCTSSRMPTWKHQELVTLCAVHSLSCTRQVSAIIMEESSVPLVSVPLKLEPTARACRSAASELPGNELVTTQNKTIVRGSRVTWKTFIISSGRNFFRPTYDSGSLYKNTTF
jgi:hypothetical protein